MAKFIKTILSNPGTLFTLSIGLLIGAGLTTVLFLVDTSWMIQYLKDQWLNLAMSALVVMLLIIVFYLFKGSVFKLYSADTRDGLGDLTEKATRLFTFFLKPEKERGKYYDEIEGTVKLLTNYLVSLLVVNKLIRYMFVLFGGLLGSAGTILLIKQNDIMEMQRVQAIEAQLSQRMKLPGEIRQSLAVPEHKRPFELSQSMSWSEIISLEDETNYQSCLYEHVLDIAFIKRDTSQQTHLKGPYALNYYEAMARQMSNTVELKSLVCPIVSGILLNSPSDEVFGAVSLLTLMQENDFKNLCADAQTEIDYSTTPLELHYLDLTDGLNLSELSNVTINISNSMIKGLKLPQRGENDILIYDSILLMDLDQLKNAYVRIEDSVILLSGLEYASASEEDVAKNAKHYVEYISSLKEYLGALKSFGGAVFLPPMPVGLTSELIEEIHYEIRLLEERFQYSLEVGHLFGQAEFDHFRSKQDVKRDEASCLQEEKSESFCENITGGSFKCQQTLKISRVNQ